MENKAPPTLGMPAAPKGINKPFTSTKESTNTAGQPSRDRVDATPVPRTRILQENGQRTNREDGLMSPHPEAEKSTIEQLKELIAIRLKELQRLNFLAAKTPKGGNKIQHSKQLPATGGPSSLPIPKLAVPSPTVAFPGAPPMGHSIESCAINALPASPMNPSNRQQKSEKRQNVQAPPAKIIRNITDPNKIIKTVETPQAPPRKLRATVEEAEPSSPTPHCQPGPLSDRPELITTDIQGDASTKDEKNYSDDQWVKVPPAARRPEPVKVVRAASGLGSAMGRPRQFSPSQHSRLQVPILRSLAMQPTVQNTTQAGTGSSPLGQVTNSIQPSQIAMVYPEPPPSTTNTVYNNRPESEEPVARNQQRHDGIGPRTYPSQARKHVISSTGTEISAAAYPLPDGHLQTWNRAANKPIEPEDPPLEYFIRSKIPVSFKDSALSSRDRSEAFQERLVALEKGMGMTGRYSAKPPHYRRSHRDGGMYGGGAFRSSHDGAPLSINREYLNPANRDPNITAGRYDTFTTSEPDHEPGLTEPVEQMVRLGCTVIVEAIPMDVSVANVVRALVDTGRIHDIQTGNNERGRFVTIRFAHTEAAERLSERKLLLVSFNNGTSITSLPISHVEETLVGAAPADPMGENYTRILTIGPCPKEYFAAGYLECAGEGSRAKEDPLDSLYEILGGDFETMPIEGALRTLGPMVKARLQFQSIDAAAEALIKFQNLQAFERVRVAFSRDPCMGKDECTRLGLPLNVEFQQIDQMEIDKFRDQLDLAGAGPYEEHYRLADASKWDASNPNWD